MPRTARKKSNTGINHIIFRGINHLDIFLEKDDFKEYLYRLNKICTNYKLELYAYCLMGNHIHLLIKEGVEDISASLKRLSVGYVQWYNKKYKRCGHLFQDRFLSEPVEDDGYLLIVSRYIHLNPVKAGIVRKPEDWEWSSCRDYYSLKKSIALINRELILGYFTLDLKNAISEYKEFMKEDNNDKCMEYKKVNKTDDEVYKIVTQLMGGEPVHSLMSLEKNKRDKIVAKVKKMEGITQRQLARVLGISQNIIFKAK